MRKILVASTALALGLMTSAWAQAPSPSSPATAPPASSRAATTTTMPSDTGGANTVVGMDVKNPSNEKVGEITDVLIDPKGKVTKVVVAVGGVLGVGARHVALSWNELKIDKTNNAAMINATKDQLKEQPEFNDPRKMARSMPSERAPATTSPAAPGRAKQ
jgi:hypothetical protein